MKIKIKKTSILTTFVLFIVALVAVQPVFGVDNLSRGHNILLQNGLQIQASCAGMDNFDLNTWDDSYFSTVHFWGTYPKSIMPSAPGLPWAITSTVSGDINPSFADYAPSLVSYQMGDERDPDITDPTDLAAIKSAMETFHVNHPDVITYTNQWGSQISVSDMQAYMQYAEPDMVMFDTYPFGGSLTGGSPTRLYRDLEKYRLLGLAGNDGTGTQPIPVGLWTQTYTKEGSLEHVVSESEIRLNSFAGWAYGCKLSANFLYQCRDASCETVLFTGNGTSNPTPQFYQLAETNRISQNLGPALVRLISTDVRMKMGEHMYNQTAVTNVLPDGVSAWDSSADPYITSISCINQGTKNDGLDGDIVVGYFKPLDASLTNEGHDDDTYFMVVNGLTAPDGSAFDCQQFVHLEFDFGSSGIDSLLKLNRSTGEVEEVALNHIDGSQYSYNMWLNGGTGDLFKFDNGGAFVGDTQDVTLNLVDNGCPDTGLHSYTLTATGTGISTLSKFIIDGEVHQVFDSEGNPSEWRGDDSASETETTDSHVIFGNMRLPDLGDQEWDYETYPEGPPSQVTEETKPGDGNSGMGTLNNHDESLDIWDAYMKTGEPSSGVETVELMQLVVEDGKGLSIDLNLLTSTYYDPETGSAMVETHNLTCSLPTLTPGDANGDGFVDSNDVAIMAQNWLQPSAATWADGDFNRDGAVNDIDATILAANWNPQSANVPEPSAYVGLTVLWFTMLLNFKHRVLPVK